MTSVITAMAIDAHDVEKLAAFWCAVLGWHVLEREGDDYISIGADQHSYPTVDFLAVPEAKSVKNRLHLDLRAKGSSTAEELDRLLELGAKQVDIGQPDDATWFVLADPEGNEFCLLSRTMEEVAVTPS